MTDQLCDEVAVISTPLLGKAGLQQAVWRAIFYTSEYDHVVLGVEAEISRSIKNKKLLIEVASRGVEIRFFTWKNASTLKDRRLSKWISEFPYDSNLLLADDSKVAFHDISKIDFVTDIAFNDHLFHYNVHKVERIPDLADFFLKESANSNELKWPSAAESVHRLKKQLIDDSHKSNEKQDCYCLEAKIHLDESLLQIMQKEMGTKCRL